MVCTLMKTVDQSGGSSRSNDPHIPTYPTSARLYNVHNHNIFVVEALRHKDVGVKAIETLTQLFEISPTSALAVLKSDLLVEHDNKYVYASANRAICPDLQFCYRLYQKVNKQEFGEQSGEGMLAALARQIESYNAACNDTYAKLKMSATGTPLVAICSPLMKRTHSLSNSGEMCFMDSSGNMDRENCRVFLLLTHTCAGGLPLGIVITQSEDEKTVSGGLELLKSILKNDAFGGRVELHQLDLAFSCSAQLHQTSPTIEDSYSSQTCVQGNSEGAFIPQSPVRWMLGLLSELAENADYSDALTTMAKQLEKMKHNPTQLISAFYCFDIFLQEDLPVKKTWLIAKCVGTSDNLVKSLLPFLKVAVEKNKPQLALKFLDKAKEWIGEIIRDVKEIVQRYEKHNSDVAKSNSDIITEKEETEKKQQQQTCEMETLQKNIEDLDANLHNINKEIEDHEKKIEQKNVEIKKFINSITNTKNQQLMQMPAVKVTSVAIFLMMVPFVEHIMNYICKMETSQESMIRTLQTGLSELNSAKQRLKEQEWDIQNELMDKQLQLAKLKIENGQIPCVSHLDEVQKCLSRIQKILVQLQKFWEKVGSLLDTLKQRTFAGEDWIDELADLKEQFLESIDAAKEGWTQFGISCMKANNIFSVQSSQAYKFLEISPSSLSKEEWEKEYESVKEKLEKIRPNTVNHKAITQ
ncbi:fibrinogen- and Ig-binding -like protein [Labeo rohita]|uniref:Fibrinogen-and Ig-binding-like protein n=1 Tax=Labeo rohita TaxID=84645 RepID=A0A498M4S6_LABRO|nr:fibrinogen- and Ig-binding -like protein [Labeo rohita]